MADAGDAGGGASAPLQEEQQSSSLPFPDIPPRQENPIELLRVPCVVQRVVVRGNKRTKRGLIDAELARARASKTHHDLAVELVMAKERLDQLDIFKATECSVDISSAADAGQGAVDVILNVEEQGAHTISTGTYMQGGEGNAEV
jgi:hypothetical protein